MNIKRRLAQVATLLLILAFTVWLYLRISSGNVNWKLTGEVWSAIQNIVTVLAIAVGGLWTYFNYFRGRVYRPRLEPKIMGKLVCKQGVTYLLVIAQLKNIGLSKIAIEQKGSGIIVSTFDTNAASGAVDKIEWNDLKAFPVFETHHWIEPGETIEDQQLFVLSSCNEVAIRLRLRLVFGGIEWNLDAIVEQSPVGGLQTLSDAKPKAN